LYFCKTLNDNKTEHHPSINSNDLTTLPIVSVPVQELILNSDERILWITKTDEPDVYNVYDNENTLSTEKIGIAFVQGMTISKMLRISFKNKNAATNLKYKCIFNHKFNKWQPVEWLQ
jgi:hypothetical protein